MIEAGARTLRQQLLWPLVFWRIKFNGKTKWMVGFPVVVGAAAGLAFAFVPGANLTGERGLLDLSAGLLQMLVGFYVAGIGIVMALPEGKLDERIAKGANPPRLRDDEMTWRQFANALTAYLVFISLVVYCLALTTMTFSPGFDWISSEARAWSKIILGGVYTGLFSHVLSITMFTLFWIAAKIPEAKNKVVRPWAEADEGETPSAPTPAPPSPES